MSVHDLLIALLLPSADDAAEDLAYNVGGSSVPRFLAMMNAKARALGLTHTHYTTPIGLDTPGNYSSAFDLDKLAAYLLAHSPFFRRIVDMPSATLHTGPVGYVVNRNDLVGRVPWINGVKTGHTSGAGYVLVASGTRDGMTLIGSVLGTSSESARDAERARAARLRLRRVPDAHTGSRGTGARAADREGLAGRTSVGDRRRHLQTGGRAVRTTSACGSSSRLSSQGR